MHDPEQDPASQEPPEEQPTFREAAEKQFVTLIELSSPSEATSLATRLQQQGIIALAKVEEEGVAEGTGSGWRHRFYISSVVVHETDFERAKAAVGELLGSEGAADDEQIQQEMSAAEHDPKDALHWYHADAKREALRNAAVQRLGLAAFALFLVGWLVWLTFW